MTCWLWHNWTRWRGDGEWAYSEWRPAGSPERRWCRKCYKVGQRLRPDGDPALAATEKGTPTSPRPRLGGSAPTPTPRAITCRRCGCVNHI